MLLFLSIMEKVWRPDGSWQNTVFDSTADKGLLFMLGGGREEKRNMPAQENQQKNDFPRGQNWRTTDMNKHNVTWNDVIWYNMM